MFKKISFVLILTLASAATVFAGSGEEDKKVSKLQGKVIDAVTTEGLAGVVIEVEGTNIKVFTDFDGNFELPALPEGSYNLKSSIVSYGELKLRNIKLNAENTEALQLKLHSN